MYISVQDGETEARFSFSDSKSWLLFQEFLAYIVNWVEKERREVETEIKLFEKRKGVYIFCIPATEFNLMSFISSIWSVR